MKFIDKKKIYQATLIIGLLVLIISFIFRYSYINIFGFDRPLMFASMLCGALGTIGAIIALIDGVNKHFGDKILLLAMLNPVSYTHLRLSYSLPLIKNIDPAKNTALISTKRPRFS